MRQKTHVPVRLTALAAFSAFAALAAATVAATPGQVVGQARGPEALGFKKHFFVDITNPSPLTLENHAIVIDVGDIRASVAPDFNTYFYAFFDVKDGEYALAVT
jgi:hypothetical protein